jgi:CTP:molybdopterin cytidylyltransferase MocA
VTQTSGSSGKCTGISGGILAAGRAERLGVSKSFVQFQSEFLIERAVRMFLSSAVENIVVAARACELDSMRGIELLRDLEHRGLLRFVVPEPGALLGASLQSLYGALQSSEPRGSALVVHQVDRPFVPWQWIDHLCHRYLQLQLELKSEYVVATFVDGYPMPPALLPFGLHQVVDGLNGDFGLRDLLREQKLKHVREEYDPGMKVEGRDLGFGFDLDTPEDLRLLLG